MKWLTALYVFFLVAVVFLADQKQYQFLFRLVRQTPYGDKIGHLVLMGLLSFLLNLALACRKLRFGKVELLAGSLMVAFVVTLEEFSQIFLRYRSFDLMDLVFDYTGIFLFGRLANLVTKKLLSRTGNTS